MSATRLTNNPKFLLTVRRADKLPSASVIAFGITPETLATTTQNNFQSHSRSGRVLDIKTVRGNALVRFSPTSPRLCRARKLRLPTREGPHPLVGPTAGPMLSDSRSLSE